MSEITKIAFEYLAPSKIKSITFVITKTAIPEYKAISILSNVNAANAIIIPSIIKIISPKFKCLFFDWINLASKSVPPVVLSPFIAIAIPTPIITLPKIEASNISEVSGVQEAPTFSISERDNILSNVLNEYLTPSIFIDTKKSGIFNTSETTNTGIPKI